MNESDPSNIFQYTVEEEINLSGLFCQTFQSGVSLI